MTPEAQRNAIIKACGWERLGEYAVKLPDGREFHVDILSSLDAMNEAEKALEDDFVREAKYWLTLYDITDGTGDRDDLTGHWCNLKLVGRATAAQRAEAFLRTLNLWDDSK